ncbi:MAG: ribbon-helix-helix protein, CopG family [Verrucomicrobiota bacterium]
MIRTQIYVTDQEKRKLRALARRSGLKQSELIRNAIDEFLAGPSALPRRDVLRRCRGMWKDRGPDEFQRVRNEVESRLSR